MESRASGEGILKHVGNISQIASVGHYRFNDGPGMGMRAVEVKNGSGLSFTVLPDRGMDISLANYKGVNLAYMTPNSEIHPAFYEPDGVGWLRTFNGGLLTTCGLAHFGPPADDGGKLGLHGRYSTIPARQFRDNSRWDGDKYLVELLGIVEEARLFGSKLRLARKITCVAGDPAICIEDKVENFGAETSSFMILYHVNLGYPLLSEHAVLKTASIESEARDEEAQKGFKDKFRFCPPRPGFKEQVFYHKIRPDRKGFAKAGLLNEKLGISFEVKFDVSSLPFLTQWKMMGCGDYVLGLEPCNAPCMERDELKRRKLLQYLEPGQSKTMRLELRARELR